MLGSKPVQRRSRGLTQTLALLSALTVAGGCMSLSPQLRPTDFQQLETLSDRSDREQAFAENAINRHDEPQGTRYTKGTSDRETKRSWQSLDAILRSDASASAALPTRNMRISRLFTALTVVAGILTVAGTAASSREGLDLQRINGTGAVLLGGGLATVGFGITAGVFYGKTKKGYERAVEIYNDSLAVRLGLNTPAGEYIPPHGVIVDREGYIVLDERERALTERDEGGEAAGPAVEEGPLPAEPGPAEAPAAKAPESLAPAASPESSTAVPDAPAEAPGGAAAPPLAEVGALDLRPR